VILLLAGKQTWIFENKPCIISSATVGGPFEAKCTIKDDFDFLFGDLYCGEDSFEKAEIKMLEKACEIAMNKAELKNDDIQFFLSGDLINQIISSSFTARTLAIPYLGIYGACSTSMEGIALGAMMVDAGFANYVMAATSSHNAASEKQYRYPTEYGAQKPPTAQWTVTGAGAVILSGSGNGPKVTSATIGKVIDHGISDPFNMGTAMAPAAADTIEKHFKETGLDFNYYDFIATGDLGRVGHKIVIDLLGQKGIHLPQEKFSDCGMMIYSPDQQVFAGGSGCACAAVMTYGHFFSKMRKGKIKRLLVIATGALLSPMSYQQNESIPSIAHAVSFEM